ncbi:tryptophan-rich sensory protein [bacterium]|nr:tryptophan-rich sensory protein [bacterium]
MRQPIWKKILILIGFILLSQLAGLIGSLFTAPSVDTWYTTLQKPSFTPPGWLFAPVWTTLYILMGISAFIVWRKGWKNPLVKWALGIFLFQLILNALWSVLFFGLKQPLIAFGEIVLLWLAVGVMIFNFHKVSRWAAYLQFPYILWVTFAALLNGFLWILNSAP